MGDTAFLGRPGLAGPSGASLRLIRDDCQVERFTATIDVERGRRNDRARKADGSGRLQRWAIHSSELDLEDEEATATNYSRRSNLI